MTEVISIKFIWIPASLGGHTHTPWDGMRVSIRWQNHIDAYLECIRDIECSLVSYDPATLQGEITGRFTSDLPIPADWLCDGELIELLNGYRVLAVGCIYVPDS